MLQAKNLVAALAAAGGFATDARKNSVFLMRKQGELFAHSRHNFNHVDKALNATLNPPMKSGDIVFVPASRLAKTLQLLQATGAFIRPVADVAVIERIVVGQGGQ